MKTTFLAAGLLGLCALSTPALAQSDETTKPSPLQFFLGAGLTVGGDNLETAVYTNGTTSKVTAGGLVQLTAGVQYRFTEKLSSSLSLSYHVSDTNASNGSIRFDRTPVELLGHYAVTPSIRLGGGVRLVNNAKVTSSGIVAGLDREYKSTTGLVVEGEYFPTPKVGVKLRLVNESYQLNNSNVKKDGSHIGLIGSYYF
jgi:outer membrane protein W